jgi:hypothetical protein
MLAGGVLGGVLRAIVQGIEVLVPSVAAPLSEIVVRVVYLLRFCNLQTAAP